MVTNAALGGPYPAACLYAQNSWVDKHKPDVQKLANALVKTLQDPAERERYCRALQAKIGWRPENDEFHLFRVDVTEVGWFRVVRWVGGISSAIEPMVPQSGGDQACHET